jgi:phosphate starvation-inducible PhoH-like protein
MGKKKSVSSKSELEKDLCEIQETIKSPINFSLSAIKCKNAKQKTLFKTIKDKVITFITGPAGTGKSYISIYTALELLKKGDGIQKLIFIYPTEEDDGEALGFMPGDESEKLMPWARADLYTMEKIFDSCGKKGKEIVQNLLAQGVIEIHPTLWLRGLTIDNSIVIISECQNLGKDNLLKAITRIGENTKMIINGDQYQISAKGIKRGKRVSGLQYAIDHLNSLEEIGVVEFDISDIIRNPLISKILVNWDPEVYGDLDLGEKED